MQEIQRESPVFMEAQTENHSPLAEKPGWSELVEVEENVYLFM